MESILAGLVPLVPMFAGLGVMILTALGWIRYRRFRAKRRGLKFPISEPLLRPAGHRLSQQMDETFIDLMAAMIVGIFASTLVLALHAAQTAYFHQPETPARWAISGAAVLFLIAYSIMRFLQAAKKLRDLRLGWIGELATAESLNGLLALGYKVFHDLQADNFNIDHVAVGPHGVFAIETKFRVRHMIPSQEAHKVKFDGATLKFPAGETDKPLVQARNQARWLSDWLSKATGEPVKAIPCVSLPGWYIDQTGRGDVVVFTPKGVEFALTKRPVDVSLSPARIKQIVYQLDQKCRDVDHRDKVI